MFFQNLQYRITAACGAGFLLFGYDQGVFGGLLDNEPFLETFGNPSETIQGQIVATYDIGCIIGTLVSMFAGDKLGRRRSILIGCYILIVGAILQTASYSLAQMIVGRVVAGVGNGMNTIAIPIWQSETARAEDRGKLIVAQLVTNIFGIVITNWMNYGFTFIPHSPVSWRFPLIAPESPRWLVMKHRANEAREILARLLAKSTDDSEVVDGIQTLEIAVNHELEVQQTKPLQEIFTGKSKQQTLRRILLGAGTAFFQQVGGTNVIAYYLPVVLTRSVGLDNRMALILSAVDSMSLMFWGVIAALLIDRIGRKRLMLFGAAGSSLCFALVAVGLRYGGSSNKGMSILAVVFIFVYYVFYGVSLLSIPYIYPAEINSQQMRNVGTSFATTTNWLFVYVIVVATPTAIANIQWKYYMLFAIFNFCFLPIIWHEAGNAISWTEATMIARTEVISDLARTEKKGNSDSQHYENVA
ncbi:hypothetical protein N7467_005297 [Penicillium canescens]|nr:hypothetical protein N7467_005297 [Penicillium canescens]